MTNDKETISEIQINNFIKGYVKETSGIDLFFNLLNDENINAKVLTGASKLLYDNFKELKNQGIMRVKLIQIILSIQYLELTKKSLVINPELIENILNFTVTIPIVKNHYVQIMNDVVDYIIVDGFQFHFPKQMKFIIIDNTIRSNEIKPTKAEGINFTLANLTAATLFFTSIGANQLWITDRNFQNLKSNDLLTFINKLPHSIEDLNLVGCPFMNYAPEDVVNFFSAIIRPVTAPLRIYIGNGNEYQQLITSIKTMYSGSSTNKNNILTTLKFLEGKEVAEALQAAPSSSNVPNKWQSAPSKQALSKEGTTVVDVFSTSEVIEKAGYWDGTDTNTDKQETFQELKPTVPDPSESKSFK